MPDLTVVFICTGNTCRSPLAAALAQRHFLPQGVIFMSAGLGALPGQAASEGSRQVAGEFGLSLDDHRSRPVSYAWLENVDWIIGMTRSHVALFKQRFPDFMGRVGLVGEPGVDFLKQSTWEVAEIADPYGRSVAEYRAVAEQLDLLIQSWLPTFERESGAASDERGENS